MDCHKLNNFYVTIHFYFKTVRPKVFVLKVKNFSSHMFKFLFLSISTELFRTNMYKIKHNYDFNKLNIF